MTRDEAIAIAREVIANKTRSYVGDATKLAQFILDEQAAMERVAVKLDELNAREPEPLTASPPSTDVCCWQAWCAAHGNIGEKAGHREPE